MNNIHTRNLSLAFVAGPAENEQFTRLFDKYYINQQIDRQTDRPIIIR